jgi:PAS domain S-box-containing protein
MQPEEVEELRARLAEAEDTLQAIREGEVDAVVVSGRKGLQIYSLTSAETSYRLIVESMKEAALTVALDGRILYSNAQFGEMLGVPLEQIIGHPLREFLTASNQVVAGTLLDRTRRASVKQRLVFTGAQGKEVPVHVSAHRLDEPDDSTVCIVAADLTELEAAVVESDRLVRKLRQEVARRQIAEAVLRQRGEQLRMLASQLTLTEQRERRRLATVLHDELQQLLVAARFHLTNLDRARKSDLHQNASEAAGLIDKAVACSRSLTAELSPPNLQHGELVEDLEWLVVWMHRKYDLTVDLRVDTNGVAMKGDLAVLLFQSVRELLCNTVKHAGVRKAWVEIQNNGDHIHVTVRDRGTGFDPDAVVPDFDGHGGFGLFSIRERLDFLGGQMEIKSAVGRGSRITLKVPCRS